MCIKHQHSVSLSLLVLLVWVICTHLSFAFSEGQATRVMIFSQYRDSVQEIATMLEQHQPLVKVMSFIGQSSVGKAMKGFTQKEQLKVSSHTYLCVYWIVYCTWLLQVQKHGRRSVVTSVYVATNTQHTVCYKLKKVAYSNTCSFRFFFLQFSLIIYHFIAKQQRHEQCVMVLSTLSHTFRPIINWRV